MERNPCPCRDSSISDSGSRPAICSREEKCSAILEDPAAIPGSGGTASPRFDRTSKRESPGRALTESLERGGLQSIGYYLQRSKRLRECLRGVPACVAARPQLHQDQEQPRERLRRPGKAGARGERVPGSFAPGPRESRWELQLGPGADGQRRAFRVHYPLSACAPFEHCHSLQSDPRVPSSRPDLRWIERGKRAFRRK